MSERIESSLVIARSSTTELTKFGSNLQALSAIEVQKYWKETSDLFIGCSHATQQCADVRAAATGSCARTVLARPIGAGASRRGTLGMRACIWLVSQLSLLGTAASAEPPPRLQTNEAYIDDILRTGDLDTRNALDVFAFVLSQLPAQVRVYPTENYYYFRFTLSGVAYAGSLRLGPAERDAGKIEFGFYKDLTDWRDTMDGDRHAILGAAEGVTVEHAGGLRYRVAHAAKSVIFELNDLSGVKPPPQAIRPQETFIGPIFDESGLRFFLLYSSKLKVFHYVLDETVPVPEDLIPLAGADRLLLGRRTGFAFYKDHFAERKILVGAYEPNSRLNNYFDGPFDQLPENFIEGETLRAAIIDADPEAKGQIDRLGNYAREEGRYMIHPYMLYKKPADLMRVHACAVRESKRADKYHACFSIEPDASSVPTLPPPAARKK